MSSIVNASMKRVTNAEQRGEFEFCEAICPFYCVNHRRPLTCDVAALTSAGRPEEARGAPTVNLSCSKFHS